MIGNVDLGMGNVDTAGNRGSGAGSGSSSAGASWALQQFALAVTDVPDLNDYTDTDLQDGNFVVTGANPPIPNLNIPGPPDQRLPVGSASRFFSGGVLLNPGVVGGAGAVQLGKVLNAPPIAFPAVEPWAAAVRVYVNPFTANFTNYLSMQSAAGGNDSIQVWSNSTVSADTLQLSLWKAAVETRINLAGVGQLNHGTIAPNAFFDIQVRFDPQSAQLRVYCNNVLAATVTSFVTMPSIPLLLESDGGQQYLIDSMFLAWKRATT